MIQITSFEPGDLVTPADIYQGTPALDQLLADNSIVLATILPENATPIPFPALNADGFINQLVALKTKLLPKGTIQSGTLTSKIEEDMTPAELEASHEQTTTMLTVGDQTVIQFNDVTPSADPPVGYPDLLAFITSLETNRNEGHEVQVSYI